MLLAQELDNNTNVIISDEYLYNKVIQDFFVRNPFYSIFFKEILDIEKIIQKYQKNVLSRRENVKDGKFEYQYLAVALAENTFLILENGCTQKWIIASSVVHNPKLWYEKIIKEFKSSDEAEPEAIFKLITYSSYIDTTDITLSKKYRLPDEQLDLTYGHNTASFLEQWKSSILHEHKGLTIYQGMPGTGKTSFIRNLIIRFNQDFDFYYLPNNQFRLLNNESTTDFWVEDSNDEKSKIKIVILEDAESVLMERATDNQQVVSNLLNMTYGLIGDAFNIHFICTVNCEFSNIDPALRREGRLLSYRKFRELNYQESRDYCSYLELPIPELDKSYTIAELHCNTMEQKQKLVDIDLVKENKSPLGFMS